MASLARARRGAKKTTTITPTRRQATKRPSGKPRLSSPGKATRPTRAASSAERPSVRSTINKVLRGALELADRFSAREGVNGPATLAQLVLRTLIFMLERDDERFQLTYQRAAVAFSEAARAASGEASGHVDGSAHGASSPATRSDVRRPADPHLRALGIEFHAGADELGEAAIADMMSLLFVGDHDPTLAIQDGVRREVRLIRHALRSDEDRDIEAMDMALRQIEARLIVARELYCRMREWMADERAVSAAPGEEGGRS